MISSYLSMHVRLALPLYIRKNWTPYRGSEPRLIYNWKARQQKGYLTDVRQIFSFIYVGLNTIGSSQGWQANSVFSQRKLSQK